MKKIRHLLEYAALRSFFLVLDALPLRAATWCAARLADTAFLLHAPRRRTALENVRLSGVAGDESEVKRIARESFRHFAVLVVESLKSGAALENPDAIVDWQIPESVERLFADEKRGVILAAGHLGNWEIAAQILSHRKPVMGITRRMNNPYVEKLVQARKPRGRFYLTPKHEADTGRFLACLKRGDVLALMIDQYAHGPAVHIPFFGRSARTYTSIALLHLITKVPIVFGYCERIGPMRFRFCAAEPLTYARTGDKERDVRAILEALHLLLEDAIRTCPEQYLWGHRRWRPDPQPASGSASSSTRGASPASM